ncbi:MAG TPA: FG-GAP-like repeat-containing protein [Thermoanaerobaculia bacterium]|nr:FG-GAP-like repeat-containing protein [Thermoanaerobaculia bacterium]
MQPLADRHEDDAPPRAPEPRPGPPRRRRLGRRRLRLRRAALGLTVAGLGALVLALWLYRASRPTTRVPGEALPEITDKLARGLPAAAPDPAFTDVTAAAGLAGFRSFAGERTSQLPEDMGAGAAWGDFDGDGDDDMFLVAAGGSLALPPQQWAPSQLYENLGDGSFRLVAGFPDTRILGMAAAWGDADGDGDLDLAVSGYGTLLLFRNQGGGRFTRDADFPSPDGYWAGLVWADFDGDGDLDLYVTGYVRYDAGRGAGAGVSQQYGAAVPYTLNPASFDPHPNLLLENDGTGRFQDVAPLWGVANPEGRSLGALWHDFDDDGRIDLYVANDISDNALFLNRGETFEDAGLTAWVADYRGAMGLAAGDWDRDGDDDLFVTHWLAQENALYDSRLRTTPPSAAEGLLAASTGRGRLTFTDVSAPMGLGAVALPLVGWGTEFADLDADGWLDLVVINGSTVERQDDRRRLAPQAPLLMWNRQGQGFHDLAPQSPLLRQPRVGRGLALADYDGDGDLDLLLVDLEGGVQLLRNDMQRGHWLQLRLRQRLASGAFGQGEGATAVAWVGDVPLRRSATGASYLSQSSRTLHFGLGPQTQVDALEVRWPDGSVERFGPLAADALWELRQGDAAPHRLRGAGGTEAPGEGPPQALSRQQVVAFWAAQRAGMDAMKRDGDLSSAVRHFRQALALDPAHEDSRYYLGTSLWALGEQDAALEQLTELTRRSPMSHRGHRQWAIYRALASRGEADLAAAARAAEHALAINGEETGSLLLLGELALLHGDAAEADRRLALACRTNPRAVGGFYLRAFLAWRSGDADGARELLTAARAARGEEWKPAGAVAEGDVAVTMHRDETPLSVFWEGWDGGAADLDAAFSGLRVFLGD